MASVFELLGWRGQAQSTPLSPLAINTPLYQLQQQSQKYYTIPKDAAAADGDILAVSIQQAGHFQLKEEHLAHLRACTTSFKEHAQALKDVDQKIVIGVVIGVLATSLSFLPFVGYFNFLGWGAASYYLNQRGSIYNEYTESLKLLVGACNWSLGEGPNNRHANKAQLIANPEIRDMMSALYPVLNQTQVQHLIADDIEESFTKELHQYESKYHLSANKAPTFFKENADERIALSKRAAEFSRCIYGFNKGKPSDFLDAFCSALPDLYHAIHYGFKRLQHWWTHKDAQTETPAATMNSM